MDAIETFISSDNPFMTIILFAIACKFLIELTTWFIDLIKNHNKKEFQNDLKNKTDDVAINEMKSEIEQFKQNRIHDREQSFEIQRQLIEKQNNLSDILAPIAKEHKIVMKTLESLHNANKEILANKINEKYKEYMAKEYIPSDEFDEFVHLHDAYKELGGNHTGDIKFNRCMKLPMHSDNEYDKKYDDENTYNNE